MFSEKRNFMRILFFVCFLSLVYNSMHAQFYEDYPYPRDRYINPLGIDWKLSGTFGEPRGNHFHAGADVKTNGATGYKLYAIADGYVARIKVSPWGYGNALYIDHQDGFTSVYAHMSSFNDVIDSLVQQRQYAGREFSQDIYLDPGVIQLKQGEVIGLSGNSGGSGGPHLHFEIRETASQRPLNPLFFGYQVLDTKGPKFLGMKWTTIHSGYFNHIQNESAYIPASSLGDTVEVIAGKIGIGVHSYDNHDESTNSNGVFRVEMDVNGENRIKWSMDKLRFEMGRYVNAFRDFYEGKKRRTVYNCFRLPGNELDVYEHLVDDGYIFLEADETARLKLKLYDFHGNSTERTLVLHAKATEATEVIGPEYTVVRYHENFSIVKDGFRAYFPERTFYDQVPLYYQQKESEDKTLVSDIHQLHDILIPMHKYAVVQIAPKGLPDHLRSKAVMVHKDLRGIEQTYTTFWKDDMISAKANEVGYFYARVDTVKPNVQWLNYSVTTETFRGDQIRVKISDELSGIADYNGYLNGDWICFEYDAKRNLLTYDFDERCPPGKHNLKVIVTDKSHNSTTKEIPFTRK